MSATMDAGLLTMGERHIKDVTCKNVRFSIPSKLFQKGSLGIIHGITAAAYKKGVQEPSVLEFNVPHLLSFSEQEG